MKNLALKLSLCLLMVLALGGAQASAHDFAIVAGWANPGGLNLEGGGRVGLIGPPIYGAVGTISITPRFGIENRLIFSHDFLRPQSVDFTTTEEIKSFNYSLNGVLDLPIERFGPSVTPFLSGGVGFVTTWNGVDDDGDEVLPADPNLAVAERMKFGTQFAISYGAGIKFERLAGPLGFRIEGRGLTLPNIRNDELHFFEILGGVLFTFGE